MRVVTVARKPVAEGTVTANVLVHGAGALCIDRCRVGTEKISQHGRKAKKGTGWEDHWHNDLEGGRSWTGRWPTNVVLAHRPGCEVVGERRVATGTAHREKSGGKTIFSETDKKPLPDMTYAGADGMEAIPDWRCEPGCPVGAMGQQSGMRPSTGPYPSPSAVASIYRPDQGAYQTQGPLYDDTGTAARFFKQVKP